MSWTLWRWVWRVASPVYVGATPSGALNRCRVYVPARPLWGALTAELARHEASDTSPDYRRVGRELRENVRLSYLYPAEMGPDGWRAWLPTFQEAQGLTWKCEGSEEAIGDRRFRSRLLWTRPSTAVDPRSDSAADGSLRETECVQTHWRDVDGQVGGRVAMAGHVFFRQDTDVNERIKAVTTVFIGGDMRYGLGRLDCLELAPAEAVFEWDADGDGEWDADGDGDSPRLRSSVVPAHAPLDQALTGGLEALGGWDNATGLGLNQHHGPVWVPGSRSVTPRWWAIRSDGLVADAST